MYTFEGVTVTYIEIFRTETDFKTINFAIDVTRWYLGGLKF